MRELMRMEKFPNLTWRINHRPDRERWETYRSPVDWPYELYGWLHRSFGVPNNTTWEYHGGWIYFYDEKCVTMYSLRWQ